MTQLIARDYRDGKPIRITIEGSHIAEVESAEGAADELSDLPFVAPGLFDIQVNGYLGKWFCSGDLTPESVQQIIQSLVDRGIARCFPTLITCSFDAMIRGVTAIRSACEQSSLVRSVVRGIHLEGPYISPEDGPRGAHPLRHVRPARFEEFQMWQDASDGLVRLVTVAPEVEGGMKFIREAAASGVVVSIGHTAASPDEIHQAADAGATMTTHFGNGCAASVNRHANIFWPQLVEDRLIASVIADGWHVPAALLECAVRCKTLRRLVLTCDVSGFGGCAPGRYDSGDVAVEVLDDGRIVVAGQRQFLAGSGATTGDCVVQMMRACRLSLQETWDLASVNPAELFSEPLCLLRSGVEATLTIFRMPQQPSSATSETVATFAPVATFVKGRTVQSARSEICQPC